MSGADSDAAGRGILKAALYEPFRQITRNAGLNADALLSQVENAKDGQGVNVNTPEKGLVDVKFAGVVDPVMVTKEAIQNAVSIAGTAMTMGALVVEIPEKEAPVAPVAPGGGMPGMGMM